VTTYSYNVAAASALLEQAGWRDADNDPSTPRLASGVQNVPDGTPLMLSYLTTNATQRLQVSTVLADSLAQCGIQVNAETLGQSDLYAPGPGGPLFGRNFDLAEFAMGSTGIEPSCEWYTSAEIPNAANHWVGTNVSGYSDPTYDSACQNAQQSLPDEPEHIVAEHQVQSIFAEALPVIPLYWRVNVAAAGPQICNFSLDPTAASALWNIEVFDSGIGCQP
jgi:peptide/nickel transport system substrate-binding protein